MNLPFNELQKSIYDRVTADIADVVLYCPFAPSTATVPFIALSAMSANDSSAKGMTMFAVSCTFDVWSDAERSFEDLHTLTDRLCASLTRRDLILAGGWENVMTRVNSASVATEFNETGAVQHGTLQLRFDLVHVP
jgi:hypothetical protein